MGNFKTSGLDDWRSTKTKSESSKESIEYHCNRVEGKIHGRCIKIQSQQLSVHNGDLWMQ